MKKTRAGITLLSTLLFIICTWQTVLGQNNVIIGRAFVLPVSFLPYSLCIGYERIIRQDVGVQLLLNNFGSDGRSTDADADFFTTIVPEVKYYFNAEKRSSSFYSAFFVELLRRKIIPSGENYNAPEITSKQISPGILVGKNAEISQKWHLELYAGAKYRFGSEEEDYSPSVKVSSKIREWGVRMGVNIARSF
ncbi:hypothetical protein WJR50_07395 [Catalinimonas sp. 4WD22]|uniref:hypothetical protein n=1 Tax=Catalinimonas locisalis TaxID=3133978 RepID=UPI003100B2E9